MTVLNLLISARRAVSEWRRRQKAYAQLSALDDRSLADIGIHRSQIPALVAGTYQPHVEAEAASSPQCGWPDTVPLPLLMPRL